MDVDAKPEAGKGLRIASGCSSLDEFTAVFRKFATPNSIFIATRSPRPRGLETRFAITLKDGKPVMRGSGNISDSYSDANNSYGRPGMVIEFGKLDTMGRILLDELNASTGPKIKVPPVAGKEDFEIPTRVEDPDEEVLAASRKSSEMVIPLEPVKEASGEVQEPSSPPLGPVRTAGSKHVLPANPFGSLSALSLEAFVECTLYEETGEVEIAGTTKETRDTKEALGAATSVGFDSAPDALDDEAALAIAAAQVAEDHRPKYVPRPPKLPEVLATPTPVSENDQASLSPAAGAEAVLPLHLDSAATVAGETAPEVAFAVAPIVKTRRNGPTVESFESRSGPSIFEFLPKSVTRVQALALAAVCLAAGLGFGSLLRSNTSSDLDSVGSAIVLDEGPRAEKLAESAPELPSQAATTAPELGLQSDDVDVGSVSEPDSDTEELSAEPQNPAAAEGLELTAEGALCVVVLDVVPREGTVRIGKESTTASASEIEIACGQHEVQIEHPRYQPFRGSIQATPGENNTLRVRLERPLVYLKIVSKPAKAEVRINARRVGTTPLRHKLTGYETARIEVTSPGYQNYTNKYYPRKSGTLNVSLRKFASSVSKKSKRRRATP